MKQQGIRLLPAVLILALLLTACGAQAKQQETPAAPETAAPSASTPAPEVTPEPEESEVSAALKDTAAYLLSKVPQPQVGSVGGEWAVLGFARSGAEVPAGYYETYLAAAEQYVREHDGVLHRKKYTEYSRVILGLTAVGADPSDVGGYDLLRPLADFEATVWQGINGPIWALIALDSGGYEIPVDPDAEVQATRDAYLDEVLRAQLESGGWALTGGAADTDLTAMAVQALSSYAGRAEVDAAIERALDCLSGMQSETGGFSSWGVESSESSAQVIVALTSLGIDLRDSRFVKNGRSALDALLTFRTGEGGFRHTMDGGADLMATEQAFYALAAAYRAETGQSKLYDMRDAMKTT